MRVMPGSTIRLLAGAWLLGVLLFGLWEVRGLLQSLPAGLFAHEEPFTAGSASAAARCEVRGFVPRAKGFALAPGQDGVAECRVRLPRPLTTHAALTLQWYGGEAGIHSAVDLVTPRRMQRLLTDATALGSRLALPAELAGLQEIGLRFTGRNAGAEERLLLDKLVIQAWDGPLPSLPHPAWVVFFALALTGGVAGLSGTPWRTTLVGGILALAALLRYVNLMRVAWAPLDPDAQGYRRYAQLLSWLGPQGFYSGGFGEREPGFPALVKTALWFVGDTDLSLRLLTLLLSVGVVWLGYRLGRSVLGFGGGVAAGLVLAVSVPAIIESGRGLRVEIESLLLMALGWMLLGRPGGLTTGRTVLAGLVGGGLLLVRFPYAVAVCALGLLVCWWCREAGRMAWRPAAILLAIAMLLALPHRLALLALHGDAGYDLERTVRWIANQEFAGQPGFPSAEAVARDPYAGPRLSPWEYYLGLHSADRLLWGSVRGLAKAVTNLRVIGYAREVEAVLGVPVGWVDILVIALGIGGLGALCRQGAAWIPVLLGLSLAHVAFVYDLGLPDYQYRMIFQGMPFFAVAVAAGGAWISRAPVRLRGIRRGAIGGAPPDGRPSQRSDR
jgi:hypothetical protein